MFDQCHHWPNYQISPLATTWALHLVMLKAFPCPMSILCPMLQRPHGRHKSHIGASQSAGPPHGSLHLLQLLDWPIHFCFPLPKVGPNTRRKGGSSSVSMLEDRCLVSTCPPEVVATTTVPISAIIKKCLGIL